MKPTSLERGFLAKFNKCRTTKYAIKHYVHKKFLFIKYKRKRTIGYVDVLNHCDSISIFMHSTYFGHTISSPVAKLDVHYNHRRDSITVKHYKPFKGNLDHWMRYFNDRCWLECVYDC